MGFFDIFKKEIACACCSQQFAKKELCFCEFETPLTGQEKQPWLCRSCLANNLQGYMESYKGRIVAVWPMKKYDGYHLYQLENMPGMEYSPSFIAAIRRKLPSGQACGVCRQEAKVAWFSPDLVKGNPVDFAAGSDPEEARERRFRERHGGHHHGMGKFVEMEFGVEETCNGEYLCGSCFAKTVVQKIGEAGWFVGQIVIPSQGDAFFTPMEAC
jgi:hypothetical protein